MPSVVPRTKMMLSGEGALMNVRTFVARPFVGVGRARSERVRAAVDVGVLALVEERNAVDHGLRLLRRRGVIEPHERASIDALLEDGEVAADDVRVEGAYARDRRSRPAEIGHVLIGQRLEVEDRGLEGKRCRTHLRACAAIKKEEPSVGPAYADPDTAPGQPAAVAPRSGAKLGTSDMTPPSDDGSAARSASLGMPPGA